MKRRSALIFTIISIALIFISVIFFRANKSEIYTITVDTNSGVAYSWEYELSADDIVSVKRESRALNNNEGGPVEIYFKIKPEKEGTAVLLLNYESLIDGSVAERREYDITVDENLNMTVSENKQNRQ